MVSTQTGVINKENEIPGLPIEQELTTEMEQRFGIRHYRVHDERGSSSSPPEREQYIFPDPEQVEWGRKLVERLDKLRKNSLRYVSRPLEVGKLAKDQQQFAISDYYPETLARLIGEHGLANDPQKKRAWKLFYQLVEGLESLHQIDLPHGALCPEKIGIDKATGTPWIRDAGWAPLGNWTRGEWVDSNARRFYAAPENREKSVPPSVKDDLYALGRIGIEMLVGRSAEVPNAREESALSQALKNAGINGARRKLLLSLSSNEPEKRPASAGDVIRQLRRAEGARFRLVLWISGSAAASLVVLLLFGVWAYASFKKSEAAEWQQRWNTADNDRKRLKGNLEDEKQKNANLQEELAACRPVGPAPGGPKPPVDPRKVEKRAGENAARLWRAFAGNPRLRFDNLRNIFEHLTDEDILIGDAKPKEAELIRQGARKKLSSWVAQFVRKEGESLTIRFGDKPACNEDSSCIRGLQVYVGGELASDLDLRDPKLSKIPPLEVKCLVDQPIRIVLYDFSAGEGRTWKTAWLWNHTGEWKVVDDRTLTGPLAMWQLKKQTLRVGTDGPAIAVEIPDCPGP